MSKFRNLENVTQWDVMACNSHMNYYNFETHLCHLIWCARIFRCHTNVLRQLSYKPEMHFDAFEILKLKPKYERHCIFELTKFVQFCGSIFMNINTPIMRIYWLGKQEDHLT